MVAKGTNLIDFATGISIGSRVGWPADRTNSLKLQLDAMLQTLTQVAPSDQNDMWSCSGVQRGNAYVSQRTRLGEIGAIREALGQSDEIVPELAQKWIEFTDKMMRDAQARAPPPDTEESAP